MKTSKKYDWSIVSGGFDPIHSGHISLLKESKKISNNLCVLLNSDKWLANKKGKAFMKEIERKNILENIKYVDKVFIQKNDDDFSTVESIKDFRKSFPKETICFCNGGDRNSEKKIIESDICKKLKIDTIFSVGGDTKISSSSSLISSYKTMSEKRPWGNFEILYQSSGYKIKILKIFPEEQISFQKHDYRDEYWTIVEGKGRFYLDGKVESVTTGSSFSIQRNQVHSIENISKKNLVIIEVQIGDYLSEKDIHRLKDKYER